MPPFGPLNYINIGPRGTLEPSGKLSTSVGDIDALLKYLEDTKQAKLTIHFHGGLVSEETGLSTARAMTTVYAAAGAHPVTFIWESGFLETVKDNLNTITQTEVFKKLLALVLKHAMKALGLSLPGKGPGMPMSLGEIQVQLASGAPFEDFDVRARGAAKVHTQEELDEMFPEIEAEVEEDVEADTDLQLLISAPVAETHLFDKAAVAVSDSDKQKGILTFAKLAVAVAAIVYRVVKRYIALHDHGFYPTVVEEILREFYLADLGEWVWGNMNQKAEQIWEPNHGLSGQSVHGGRYFLEGVARLQQRQALTLDLVGHSAGSIVICHLLKIATASNLSLKIRNVIFMAPACTSKLFLTEIVRPTGRFANFRMFTMNEEYECKNRLVPLVYTRSLLYLISGALDGQNDEPVAGMERFLQDQPPFAEPDLREIVAFLRASSGERLVLSKTTDNAPRGMRCTAERHQDFDENGPMQDSLIFLIAQ